MNLFFRLFIILILLSFQLTAYSQTRKIEKWASSTSLFPYSPKSVNSLKSLPPRIEEKLVNHLLNRLGKVFYNKLNFVRGSVVNFDDLRRASPNSNFQWKVFTYALDFSFSIPEKGIKIYEATIWLDENGEILREIDIPAINQNPEKASFISVNEAIRSGKKNKFKTKRVQLAYNKENDAIVWRLIRKGSGYRTSELDISIHTGKILKPKDFNGDAEISLRKEKKGYVFGEVFFKPEKEGDYADWATNIIIELKHKGEIIKIITNEGGLIDERLLRGEYQLLSAKNNEGVSLVFGDNQNKSFQIQPNKTIRFSIMLIKPKK